MTDTKGTHLPRQSRNENIVIKKGMELLQMN